MTAVFFNRHDAGRRLGEALHPTAPPDPIVIGLSFGGVPVAAEVARILDAPLDICIVRRLMHDDLTIGAVSEGAIYLDDDAIAHHQIEPAELETAIQLASAEIVRSAELLRDGPPLSLVARDVILVDDGVTSGATIRAAARALRRHGPRTVALAVPVASISILATLRPELDRVSCLDAEPITSSIGARYQEFLPVSEAEVVAMLASAQQRASRLGPAPMHALGLGV